MQKHPQTRSSGRAKETAPLAPADNGVGLTYSNAPLTFRLPPPREVDPYFSYNRSAWNELILPTVANGFKPSVKSIVERKPGNAKGRRLIVFESARRHFEQLLAATEAEVKELARQHAVQTTSTEAA